MLSEAPSCQSMYVSIYLFMSEKKTSYFGIARGDVSVGARVFVIGMCTVCSDTVHVSGDDQ